MKEWSKGWGVLENQGGAAVSEKIGWEVAERELQVK